MRTAHRTDIRKRALRAAAQVAMLGGAGLGCGGSTPLEALQPADLEAADAASARVDGGQAVDAGVVVVTDAGVVQDAGLAADAGLEICDSAVQTPEDWAACCERNGWDWDRGCSAWGPPAPPSMPEGVA